MSDRTPEEWLGQLHTRLRHLYALVGKPTDTKLAHLASQAQYSLPTSTANDLRSGDRRRRPRLQSVEGFVAACLAAAKSQHKVLPAHLADLDAWELLWEKSRGAVVRDGKAEKPSAEPAHAAKGRPADSPDAQMTNTSWGGVAGVVGQVGAFDDDALRDDRDGTPSPLRRYRAGLVPTRADRFQERAVSSVLTATEEEGNVHTTVLWGLGGVGKTQLAAGHAEKLWRAGSVDLLVWITASTREEIVAEYARLAADLLAKEEPDPDVAARRFLAWLATTSARWLMVLDDLRKPEDLRDLWPPEHPTGSVIVTTRRTDASLQGHGRKIVKVGLFAPKESSDYLTAKFEKQPYLADDVTGLASTLEHLPLALSQAAAYMVDQQLTCSEYRQLFEDRRRKLSELVPTAPNLPDGYPAPLATTWSLSVELADTLVPVGMATPVLNLMSVMDPNGIPVEMFATAVTLTHLSAVTRKPVTAETARNALTCLHRLSLVDFDRKCEPPMTRVHALVQRATHDDLSDCERTSVPRVVAGALREMWRTSERKPALVQSVRSNSEALHVAAGQMLWTSGDYDVLYCTGDSLGNSGHVAGALHYFEQLCEEATEHLGASHAAVLEGRQRTACWLAAAGYRTAAATALRQLLSEQASLLGPHHVAVLATRCHLIEVSDDARDGSGMDAGELHELGVDAMTALGPEHPLVLRVLSNLVRSEDGKRTPPVTRTLYQKIIGKQQRVRGPQHRDTLRTRCHRASWRMESGDLSGALVELEVLIRDQILALGKDHPDVLASRSLLTRLRSSVAEADRARWGRVSNAGAAVGTTVLNDRRARLEVESWLKEHFDDCSRVLGKGHPDTVLARSALEDWTVHGARRDDVDKATRRIAALELRLASLQAYYGAQTMAAFEVRAEIARLYGATGEVATATAMLEQLYVDQVAVLGPDATDLAHVRRELVWHRAESGDRAGAVRMLVEIASEGSRADRAVHADLRYWTGEARDEVQADVDELTRMLEDDTARFGLEHRYTLNTRYLLASRLGASGRRHEAVVMLRETHEMCARSLGTDHPASIRAKDELAWWQQEAE